MSGFNKKGWKKVMFGDMCRNLNVSETAPLTKGIERYVGLEHIEPGSLHIKNWGNIADGTTFTKSFKPGHVLFGKRRAYQKKAAVANFAGICSGDILVLEANETIIDKRLLPFVVSSDLFFDYAVKTSAGSLSPRTKFQDLAKLEFLLPPKEQQAKLAELLWAADDVVEGYGEMERFIQNVLESAYQDYFVKDSLSKIQLGDIADVIMGQSPDGSTYNTVGNGVALINGPTEFTDRYPIKKQWTSKPTKLCRDADILLCVRGSTTGRMNISNDVYCIGRGVAAIRGTDRCKTDFLEHVLTHFVSEILKLASGSTFPNIDSKSLKSILIPLYSIKEQELIADKMNSLSNEQSKIISTVNSSQHLQRQLINSIFGV